MESSGFYRSRGLKNGILKEQKNGKKYLNLDREIKNKLYDMRMTAVLGTTVTPISYSFIVACFWNDL